jgi:hypothetical protein
MSKKKQLLIEAQYRLQSIDELCDKYRDAWIDYEGGNEAEEERLRERWERIKLWRKEAAIHVETLTISTLRLLSFANSKTTAQLSRSFQKNSGQRLETAGLTCTSVNTLVPITGELSPLPNLPRLRNTARCSRN